jgi:FKBP-type peptidyl-prolyl cis-trans isomerase
MNLPLPLVGPRAVFRTSLLTVALLLAACGGDEAPKPDATPEPTATPAEADAKTPAPPVSREAPPVPEDVAAAPADATKTASGMSYKVLQKGSGAVHPTADAKVTVHYTGWTTDGKMFDSSVTRGKPAEFPLKGVIKGWTEGVQLMVIGEKTRFWIPGDMAYGETPRRPGAPAGTLVFDIELLEIQEPPPPIPAPDDVKGAPASAKTTDSGLAWKVLTAGTGPKPAETDRVKVHYTGWTTDGTMFDSSVQRGKPATFPLNRVIKGWTEGLQLMQVGEKSRFWIPADMAYGETPKRPGAPSGMLVFDIELIEIVPPAPPRPKPTIKKPVKPAEKPAEAPAGE